MFPLALWLQLKARDTIDSVKFSAFAGNKCSCDDGTPAEALACMSDGAHICTSCATGFHLRSDVMVSTLSTCDWNFVTPFFMGTMIMLEFPWRHLALHWFLPAALPLRLSS